MKIQTLPLGNFEANCHLVSDDAGHTLVVDPGADADQVSGVLRDHRLTVAAYLITHGHMDHLSALADLERDFPAPVGIHPADGKWAFGGANQMPPFYGIPQRPRQLVRAFTDNQEWTDFDLHYRVLATPGHSPGCVCFYFPGDNTIFTGDTLFAGSVGRTDLPGGDERLLTQSLTRLAGLPSATVVYPGHGPQTTIGQEKKTNPFLRALS
jgi:glyoxylase-like metal-dependent hydrolase (beta-lactamase superfamily II)